MSLLTEQEKDQFARRLAYSATVGGWFFIGMAVFVLIIASLPLLGLTALDGWESDMIGAFVAFLLAFLLPGNWLLRRKAHIRRLLDGELLLGTAEVTAIDSSDPSSGIDVLLRVKTPAYTEADSRLRLYGLPPWQVGEEMELLFLEDEVRFFPRHLTQNMNLGRVDTLEQADSKARRLLVIWFILGCLILLGFSLGFYQQLTTP